MTPAIAVRARRLPCGLDVLVHADPSSPQVCVSVWYRVGSSDERADLTGFAHLFEHVFKPSPERIGGIHYDLLKRAGSTDANASTGSDRTAYHEVVPADQLPLALWLESERMGFFVPDAERLATQQSVVRSERRQRYEDVPYGEERFAIALALYPEGHPSRYLTIGKHDDIQAATVDDIAAWYRTWYVPANATLTIAGDVGDDVDALVDRYFGGFPAAPRPQRARIDQPVVASSSHRIVDRFATLPRIHRVWHGPAAFDADEADLDIVTSAWTMVGGGELWRRLVYETQLAQRVSAWIASTRLGGELHVAVDLRGGADPAAVRAILDDVVPRPIEPTAIERAITRREASAIWNLVNIARRAATLQRYALYTEDPDGLAAELARYRAVTPSSIARAVARWLDPAKMIEVETVPA
jgi:predicted Zn-dependent peptidase